LNPSSLISLLSTGCLDSLVYYKRLLVTLLERESDSTQEEREKLNLECVGMLKKLEEVDPMRRARYVDLGTLSSFSLLASRV
jgi:geranylgeranyl transferase type-2 subunit alpha